MDDLRASLKPLPKLDRSSLNGILLGMCNALLDITVDVSIEYLNARNLKPNDAIISNSENDHIIRDVAELSDARYTAGGCGQNTIRGAQWILPANSTVFLGCIGNDRYGELLKETMRETKTIFMVSEHMGTGMCASLITNNGTCRSLVANLSASLDFNAEFVKENWNVVENARVFYTTGFMVQVSSDAVLLLARHALDESKIFSINLSSTFLFDILPDEMKDSISHATFVFGNCDDFRAFAKLYGLEGEPKIEMIKKLSMIEARASSQYLVATDGPNSTIVSCQGNFLEVPVEPVGDIVDTNGAGDAFVAGFLAAFIMGYNLHTCVTKGHELSSVIIRTSGVSYPEKRRYD